MAITSSEQSAILELVVLMFDAAPGVYLGDIQSAYEQGGHSLSVLADVLDSTGAYLSLHPSTESAASFADAFLTPLGLQDDQAARQFITSQLQAGVSKGAIAVAAWNYLHTLPANFPAQYQAAKAIMENKADVAAHYSLVLQGTATGVVALQQVLSLVTADPASVAQAIDWLDDAIATGPELTTGTDVIHVPGTAATNVSGLLDGNSDGGTGSATFNATDFVHGNGNTNVKLELIEPGTAPAGGLSNIESVYINAAVAGGVALDAAAWEDVGSVVLDEGVDGSVVAIDNLEPGTALAVQFIEGTLEVGYAYEGGANVTLTQPTAGGEASFVLRSDGDVVADLGEGAQAAVSIDGEVGTVSLAGGDAVQFALSVLQQDAGLSIGDADLSAGAGSTVEIDVADVADDLSVGDISVHVEDGVQVRVAIDDVGGDATIGDVTMHDTGAASVAFELQSVEGNLAAGAFDLDAGEGGSASLVLDGVGGTATVGAVAVAVAAGPATARLGGSEGSGALSLASASVQSGADGDDASFTAEGFGSISAGAITVQGTGGAAVAASVEADAGNATVGNVTVSAGDGSTVAIAVESTGGNATAGALQATGGDDAHASVALAATGSVTAGAMQLTVTDSAAAHVSVLAADALDAGLLSMTGGEGLAAEATIEVDGGTAAGAFHAAGAHVAAGQDAVVSVEFRQSVATASAVAVTAGDMTVDGFTAELGDNARVSLAVVQSAEAAAASLFTDGDLVVGDIDISASATTDANLSGGSELAIDIVKSAAADGAGGAMEVGDISLAAGNDAGIDLEVSYDAAVESIGDVSVGVVSLVVGDDAAHVEAALRVRNSGDIGDVAFAGAHVVAGADSSVTIDLQLDKKSSAGTVGDVALGNYDLVVGEGAVVDVDVDMFGMHNAGGIGNVTIGTIDVAAADGGRADLAGMGVPAAGLAAAGAIAVGAVTATLGEGASFAFDPSVVVEGALGDVTLGQLAITAGVDASFDVNERFAGASAGAVAVAGIAVDAGAGATGEVTLRLDGSLDAVEVGNISLQLAEFADVHASLYFGGEELVESAAIGDILVDVEDGAEAILRVGVHATDAAGDMLVGDITLVVQDLGVETVTVEEDEVPVAGRIEVDITHDGADDETLTIGTIAIEVQGTEAGDEAWMFVAADGDVVIGDIIVTGDGKFVLDGDAHNATGTADEVNTSFLAVQAAGEVTVGNIDFSGYGNDVTLDLSWVDHGAATITAGAGDDVLRGTAGNNTLVGGLGIDDLDISQGGVDTVRFSSGHSGKAEAALDDIIGFQGGTNGAGDKLDFNLAAGAQANYVEGSGAASYSVFLQHANSALNSTVTYFAEVVAGTVLVAVNYGSGEADLVVRLVGVSTLESLAFQNFVA